MITYSLVLKAKKFYKNAKQEVISQPIEVVKSVKGEDIQLTIDATIQFFAYKYLAEAIKKIKPMQELLSS